MDIILSGRMMGVQEAEKLGLVSRVISSENFRPSIRNSKRNI